MAEDCNHTKLLSRNGTSQNQRFLDVLYPENVKLHHLSEEDWMHFAAHFAEKLMYFDTTTNELAGDWSHFFPKKDEITSFISKLKLFENNEDEFTARNTTPHLALFATFLKLSGWSQKRLNQLTKKHLDFYYGKVLNLHKKAPVPDQVHLLFELAKNVAEQKIEEATELDGGKDASGKKRSYKTQKENIINKAKVVALRNVFVHKNNGLKNSFVANSFDGLGEDFPEGTQSWWPFGHPFTAMEGAKNSLPSLPFAKVGFAVASPVLFLKEGKRTVTFTVKLDAIPHEKISVEDIAKTLTVQFSGEKEWLEASISTEGSSVTHTELKLTVILDKGISAIVGYNREKLLEPFNTEFPVARFLLNYQKDNETAEKLRTIFTLTLVETIEIVTNVWGLQDVVIENDFGKLDASKPFYPFGPTPVKGGNFFIGLPEALEKNWENITVDFSWKDKPADFADRYLAYREEFSSNISKETYSLKLADDGTLENPDGLQPIVENENHFKAEVHVLQGGIWKELDEYNLFDDDWQIGATSQISKPKNFKLKKVGKKISDYKITFNTGIKKAELLQGFQSFKFSSQNFSAAVKEGFVRITLKQSFLHEMYPKIYSVALSKFYSEDVLVPNEPYTPLAETIKVGYTAKASAEDIQLFHEHPFGISEEDSDLKNTSVLKPSERKITLLPPYANGTLYIGLQNIEPLQQVSLLIQALEGSENPESTNDFEAGEQLQWSVLCKNEWLSLNKNHILLNSTDNFLKTGIVTINIPPAVTTNNTKLPSGLTWLKVENTKDFDTTSQLIDIKAQVITAQFEAKGNTLEHLEKGLPAGSISKLTARLATIKKVGQPFNTFGGKAEENDADYYRRVSERLRHKQRAVTIWDYEHLVLQKFPSLYKVNCLNHTSIKSPISPGDVTIVTIPNIIGKNSYDSYKPRISKAMKNEITAFINQLNTLHVTAEVINPTYEEIKVSLKVKFYKGFDEHFYTQQLKKDIAKLFSPWAFEQTNTIEFGVALHESFVIDYIEKLGYVDFITDFRMFQETGKNTAGNPVFTKKKKVVPTTAQSILTSVKYKDHDVSVLTKADTCTKIPEKVSV